LSARMLLRVAEFCRSRGHDAGALCKSAGLDLAVLSEPSARVHYDAAARLGEKALEVTRDDNFGLHLAADVQDTRNFDTGTLLLMASPTVRSALERMVRHQRYWGDGERASVHRARGGLAIRYALPGAEGAYARHADECAMAEIALGVRFLTGRPLHPRLVRFRHAPPPDTSEHRALFQCAIEHRAAHTEIVFDDAVLDAPMLHANAAFCAIFEEQVERALSRLPAGACTSEGVRGAARAALAAGACTLAGTARALGVSTRTLQRRLLAEGTSFGQIVDALRRELALAYLERRMSIADVASQLGYADTAAFHHAFRRWTGSSPSRYAASMD
jgi:AraC-like DNA-binding protein